MNERQEEMNQGEFETFKKLILIQLQRIKKAGTLEEAKEVTEETIKALEDEKE